MMASDNVLWCSAYILQNSDYDLKKWVFWILFMPVPSTKGGWPLNDEHKQNIWKSYHHIHKYKHYENWWQLQCMNYNYKCVKFIIGKVISNWHMLAKMHLLSNAISVVHEEPSPLPEKYISRERSRWRKVAFIFQKHQAIKPKQDN